MAGRSKSIVFDPFKDVGLPEPRIKADIVLCSHSHYDHSNVAAVKHETSVVMEGVAESRQVDGVSIRGVVAFHDESGGTKRGMNTIYVVNLDGVEFCHLGDLGQELSAQQAREIGSPHVLFIPVGGFYTIGPDRARAVIRLLKPLITVPMHYRVAGMSKTFDPLSTIEDFLRPSDNVRRLNGTSFTVNQDAFPDKPLIIVPRLV